MCEEPLEGAVGVCIAIYSLFLLQFNSDIWRTQITIIQFFPMITFPTVGTNQFTRLYQLRVPDWSKFNLV